MTHRFLNYRTAATLVASVTVGAGALALAAESSSLTTKDKKVAQVGKFGKDSTKDRTAALKRSKAKVSKTQRQGSSGSQTPSSRGKGKSGRIALKPLDNHGKRPQGTNPYLVPAKHLITKAEAAYHVDPVTGIGVMMTPDGTPLVLELRPSTVSSAWVGRAMGDEWSTAFVIETKYGPAGMVQSPRWGAFRFLPHGDGTGNVRISSTNQNEIGTCGNETDWDVVPEEFEELLAMGGLAGGAGGGLAGGGNCWSDTKDQTTDGVPYWLDPMSEKGPSGQSYTVVSANGLCSGAPELVLDTPDIPDWRVMDEQCTGFPLFGRYIDILFGYSQDVVDEMDGTDGVNAMAIAEIALLNETFVNSQMPVRARLVGTELGRVDTDADQDYYDTPGSEPYVGTFSPPADRNALVMEYLPNVQGLANLFEDLRDERGADIVTLIVANNNTGVAGIAMDIPMQETGGITGGSAAKAGAVSTLGAAMTGTYQHEVGHLMGGCHGSPNAVTNGLTDNTNV